MTENSKLLLNVPDAKREEIEWLDVWIVDGAGTALPRVLLIGDSITRSYTEATARLLNGKASVSRMATSKSLGDPALLAETALVVGMYPWDVIHFNNGLHGRDYTEDEYAAALPDWLALLKRTAPAAQLIWASTTAARDNTDLNVFDGFNDRVARRNEAAAAVMNEHGIHVDNLHAVSSGDPGLYWTDGVHFSDTGVQELAKHVARSIVERLTTLVPNFR